MVRLGADILACTGGESIDRTGTFGVRVKCLGCGDVRVKEPDGSNAACPSCGANGYEAIRRLDENGEVA